ncbi:MAG TPA: hypothetical protein DCQ10_02540 [Rhodobacteraceae bacterium]|nr:hypothetical protein [Paracoccaceae bacterium]
MRKHNGPAIANPLVKSDFTLIGLCGKIWNDFIKTNRHWHPHTYLLQTKYSNLQVLPRFACNISKLLTLSPDCWIIPADQAV